jgi:hypothetical protein
MNLTNNKETTLGLLRGGCCYDCKHCVTDVDPKTDSYFAYCDLRPSIHFPERQNLPDVIHRSCRKFVKYPMLQHATTQIKLSEALIDLFKI